MTKMHKILAGVLVLQIALATFLLWPRSAPAAAGAPLLGELKAEEISSLSIRDGQGASVKLAKQGSAWILPEAGDYPADATKVSPVLAKLASLKGNRLVTRTEGSEARLKVADNQFERRVDITTNGGAAHTVFFGSAPSARTTHFRLAGHSETYLTSELTGYEINADPASWIDTAYVTLSEPDITEMRLQNAAGQFAFTRDATGWTMAGLQGAEKPGVDTIGGLARTAATLRMARPLGKDDRPEYGLASPVATFTLKAKDKEVTLLAGAKRTDARGMVNYVVKSSESPYYVEIADFYVKDWVEKSREGFLQPPPTAGGTPAP